MQINVHSVIDTITNSSTEIFCRADESSVETVKELIDSFLGKGSAEMFTVTLQVDSDYVEDHYYDFAGQADIPLNCDIFATWGNKACSKYREEKIAEIEAHEDYQDHYKSLMENSHYVGILVEPKLEHKTENTIKMAKMLSKLDDLFDVGEHFC